jgi:hypothetical protein
VVQRDGQVAHARLLRGVGHQARQVAVDHARAVGLGERRPAAELDAERDQVAGARPVQQAAVREPRDDGGVEAEVAVGELHQPVDLRVDAAGGMHAQRCCLVAQSYSPR